MACPFLVRARILRSKMRRNRFQPCRAGGGTAFVPAENRAWRETRD
jgi:hypothetical protein